jgi:hypothetical protein
MPQTVSPEISAFYRDRANPGPNAVGVGAGESGLRQPLGLTPDLPVRVGQTPDSLLGRHLACCSSSSRTGSS